MTLIRVRHKDTDQLGVMVTAQLTGGVVVWDDGGIHFVAYPYLTVLNVADLVRAAEPQAVTAYRNHQQTEPDRWPDRTRSWLRPGDPVAPTAHDLAELHGADVSYS